MCKKCQQLKAVWWSKQQLVIDYLSFVPNTHSSIYPERNSALKALRHQRNKHAKV